MIELLLITATVVAAAVGFRLAVKNIAYTSRMGHMPSNPYGLPYHAPPPPWHGQHKEGCPSRAAYDRRSKPRVRVCGCCGNELPHRHPKPPRVESW